MTLHQSVYVWQFRFTLATLYYESTIEPIVAQFSISSTPSISRPFRLCCVPSVVEEISTGDFFVVNLSFGHWRSPILNNTFKHRKPIWVSTTI